MNKPTPAKILLNKLDPAKSKCRSCGKWFSIWTNNVAKQYCVPCVAKGTSTHGYRDEH